MDVQLAVWHEYTLRRLGGKNAVELVRRHEVIAAYIPIAVIML